jgi:hypothetical protein
MLVEMASLELSVAELRDFKVGATLIFLGFVASLDLACSEIYRNNRVFSADM